MVEATEGVSWGGGNGVLGGSVTVYLYSTTIDDFSKFVQAGYFCIQNNVFPSQSGVLDFLSCLPSLDPIQPARSTASGWAFLFPVGAQTVDTQFWRHLHNITEQASYGYNKLDTCWFEWVGWLGLRP